MCVQYVCWHSQTFSEGLDWAIQNCMCMFIDCIGERYKFIHPILVYYKLTKIRTRILIECDRQFRWPWLRGEILHFPLGRFVSGLSK